MSEQMTASDYAEQAKTQLDAGVPGAGESAAVSVALSLREIAGSLRELAELLSTPEAVTEPPEPCAYEANHPNIRRSGRKCPICGLEGDELA